MGQIDTHKGFFQCCGVGKGCASWKKEFLLPLAKALV